MSVPLDWLAEEIASLQVKNLLRERRCITKARNGHCRLNGRLLFDFSSNDYLGLAGEERLREAALCALRESGCGATASALVSGRSKWHERLEQRLAEFEGEESAILFPTGYAANIGTLTALIRPEDILFCDRFNHASLVDGCRLSRATLKIYRHDDLSKLERELKKAAGFSRRWIITDAVFSMDGDVAPLQELCELAERFDAAVIVDEAHGTGVFGPQGRGVCEEAGVEERVAVRIGTLSKALGCLGGFVTGSELLTGWLWNTARPQMFSTALPPAICAAALAAVDIMAEEPQRRQRLHQRTDQLRKRLREAELAVPDLCVAPIVPVILGESCSAVEVARQLEKRGFLVAAIRPPTVPAGTARLRISLSAAHSAEAVDRLAAAVAKCVTEVSAGNSRTVSEGTTA